MSRSPKISPPASARLFSDPRPAAPPADVYIANIDGASRGNPGPAAYGVILRDASGKEVLRLAKRLGRETNNVAEYYALLAVLDYAAAHGITGLRVRSDSELLVRQMQGRYKVKSVGLKPLHARAAKLSRQLAYFALEHVPREMNSEADILANAALDGASPASAQPPAARAAASPASKEQAPPKRIRAKFVSGVFVPAEAYELPEGSEVLLDILIEREK